MSFREPGEFNSIDEFLGHNSRAGSTYLSSWKGDRKDSQITVWLHTKRLPIAVWQHGLPKIVVKQSKDTGSPEIKIFGGKHNCHEDERTLKNYRRDNEGNREAPFLLCPGCRMVEAVRQLVQHEKIPWTAPVFRFDASDPRDSLVLHAGGLYNAFGRQDLTDDEREELKDAGISPKNAWRENAMAKLNYIFCVVDNAHPENGCVVTTETALLGDRVKDVIRDTRESLKEPDDEDAGDVLVNPYAIEWLFFGADPKLPFNDKYKARRLARVKLTPEIEKAIRGTPPDLTGQCDPFKIGPMRDLLEKHCVLKKGLLNWDQIFDVKQVDRSQEPAPTKGAAKGGGRRMVSAPEPTPKKEPEVEKIPCDHCGEMMGAKDPTCPECGAAYEVTDDEEEQAAKPAEQKAEPAPEKKGAKGKKGAKAEERATRAAEDDIPF